MIEGAASDVWSAPVEGRFDWRIWGDDAVVYVHASASTHALSPGASAVLATLLEQGVPLRAEQLLAKMSVADGGDDEDPDPVGEAQAMYQLLSELERLGIAQRFVA